MVYKVLHSKPYPAALTDEPWAQVGPMIPPAKQSQRGGRPRKVARREVLQTLCSLNRSGCPWARRPHDFLPQSTVSDSVAPWRADGTWATWVTAWRAQSRGPAGREPTPSALGIASQAVKSTERGGPERGEEGGKTSQGRQRPLVVETLAWLMALLSPRAGRDAGVAAPQRLGHLTPHDVPRRETILADMQDPHHDLDVWRAKHRAGGRLAVTTRPEGTKGCTPLAPRWVIERTHAWHGRYRRHTKDDESCIASRTARVHMSHRHLRLNRLSPNGRPVFHSRKEAA